MDESIIIGLLLIVFLLVGAFMVLNMLIGVVCEIVSQSNKEEMESQLRSKLLKAFKDMDQNDDSTINRLEFESGKTRLQSEGVDSSILDSCFAIMDSDDSGEIERTELKKFKNDKNNHNFQKFNKNTIQIDSKNQFFHQIYQNIDSMILI